MCARHTAARWTLEPAITKHPPLDAEDHVLDGKVLGMLGQSGKQLKQFGMIHEMACPSENVIYVGELLNWRVQKLILKP
jgi:hypothetical protein